MSDPHELTADQVADVVTEDALGVYMLYADPEGSPSYVGRAEQVRSALLDHVDDYEAFWADRMPNATAAYNKQVDLFHFHGGTEALDNDRHPQRPHKNVKCRHCDGDA
jgi:hypothetical protein